MIHFLKWLVFHIFDRLKPTKVYLFPSTGLWISVLRYSNFDGQRGSQTYIYGYDASRLLELPFTPFLS